MAKFSGLVGFQTQVETAPSVWTPIDQEVKVRGDLIKAGASSQNGDKVISEVSLNHRVSIVASSILPSDYYNIKYVELHNVKWTVTSIEIHPPRLVLSLGGVYNG